MKKNTFCNPSVCGRAASILENNHADGITNPQTDEIELTAADVEKAAELFREAVSHGGRYFNNIICQPYFTMKQCEVVLGAVHRASSYPQG